jgi:hypothetical protein
MRTRMLGAALAAMTLLLGLAQWPPARPAEAATPTTTITINGNGGDRVYDGVGAVLGGGGNARYLMEYPEPERSQILDELFTPGVGASLQLLKLEIGGDANSTDGAESSIEHVQGQVNCSAGYELAIAAQAVARNRFLRLYGLQWAAPGWVGAGTAGVFTSQDIQYLLDWLGCAHQYGLTISYLGGWNESDDGSHAAWFHQLRTALDAHGYGGVQIVAGDSSKWQYTSSADVDILGVHDNCGYPTGTAGPQTTCTTTSAALSSGKPLWGSELGAMDAGAQNGCTVPCAPAMDRATVRGYIDARMTGYLEWPVLDAMPPGLFAENRGLVTADQPWSGQYSVNAMAWAIAHFTQFVWPPNSGNPGGWKYIDSASGFLQGNRADGSYVSLLRSQRDGFSTIIETTSGVTGDQTVKVNITGGAAGLSAKTVHVWASDFDFSTDSPSTWFVQQPDITPVNGSFTLTVKPGYVYSLTTTTGQGKVVPSSPAATPFPLPYTDELSGGGNATGYDDEPPLLAAQDGSFELAPCAVPDAGATTCTVQQARSTPVFWHTTGASPQRFPYAMLGSASWTDYTVAAEVLLTQPGTTAGVIGRLSQVVNSGQAGAFAGYLFDVGSTGAWRLLRDSPTPGPPAVLASGTLDPPPGTGSWHRVALRMAGPALTASVDGRTVAAVSDSTWTTGQAGLEAGAFTKDWPQAQYSHLTIAR